MKLTFSGLFYEKKKKKKKKKVVLYSATGSLMRILRVVINSVFVSKDMCFELYQQVFSKQITEVKCDGVELVC